MASLPDFEKQEPLSTKENCNPGNEESKDDKNTPGFECEFVEKPPSFFQSECPVCLLILRKPYQVTCCGKSYCRSCIEKIKSEDKPCPTCNAEKFADFPNKGLQQPLYQFKVRCTHQKQGCEWTGELGELDNHLNLDPQPDSELTGCDYAEIDCRYRYAGCKVRVSRIHMKTHITNESVQHLALLENQYKIQSVELEKTKTEKLKLTNELSNINEQWLKKIQAHFPIPPVTLTMTHFGYYHENEQEWFSPPFYTDFRGYKLCLRVTYNPYRRMMESSVSPYSTKVAAVKYLRMEMFIMEGEFDEELKWPMDRQVEVELIRQCTSEANVRVAIYEKPRTGVYHTSRTHCLDRVTDGQVSEKSISNTKSTRLIPTTDIYKFVKNDCMEFRIVYAGPKR